MTRQPRKNCQAAPKNTTTHTKQITEEWTNCITNGHSINCVEAQNTTDIFLQQYHPSLAMNSRCSGMKRSMPCVDLNSMALPNDTSRLEALASFPCLDGQRFLGTEIENLAPKKRRLSPLDAKKKNKVRVNPATEALDQFLRISCDDLILDFFDLLEEDSPIKFHTTSNNAFHRKGVASIYEVTRGMARLTSSTR